MKPLGSDEEDELSDYQKKLRERANRSIQQLSSTLSQQKHGEEESEVVDASTAGSSSGPRSASGGKEDASWSKRFQSEAVNQLRTFLMKQQKETSPPLSTSQRYSPSKLPQGEGGSGMTAIQDLVPIIYNQSEYIQHLEAEVKFCKEEVQGVKQRVRVVVVENEKLQSSLNKTLMDKTVLESKCNESPGIRGHTGSTPGNRSSQGIDDQTWKEELEQLKALHQAQTETLEDQVTSLRRELVGCQRGCEEAASRLRQREAQAAKLSAGAPRVGGLCLKCAQHKAVMAETHSNVHVQAIERLTKERDEVLVALRAVRASQEEAQQREWSACLQVKQAVEVAEEANLHKAQVELQCEQLSRELGRQRERLEREAQGLQERLAEAREEARGEARREREELGQTVSNLSQQVAELEGQLDRANRERTSLTNQLEDTLRKLTNQEQESTTMCVDLRYQLSQAVMKRKETESELRELATKTSRQTEHSSQEVEKLSSVLVGCQHRLEAVQKDGSQWQTEALSLAEQLANAQRQLHLTRQEKDSAEHAYGEDLDSALTSAQQRESELVERAGQQHLKHKHQVEELDGLLTLQNSLIGKLKEECCMLGAKLEELSQNSRAELEQVSLERQHLQETGERLRARCSDLENQCVQHGRLHQRMKDRLQQLDRHCQSSAQQVCELLATQNQLMEERRALNQDLHM
ncbi:serologically defined colon cancer antigen 8 homolog isoform X1 [Gadus chalcogrammus]|uniref:serologically defined colon cancer antigen 8 homolog isoform X1 n=1 Tax=Gadus chalcogrammus TaxID=1042646 RepID=UPI0024C488E4|nr:serologically defined colon cancer antigen 8 homolog isoform X1 [Gadus chalcogrammus]